MTVLRRAGDDRIVELTLNDPERSNAMGDAWWAAFAEVLDDLERAPDLRVVTVTGAGDAFSAGGDVQRMRQAIDALDPAAFVAAERERMRRIDELLCRWVALPAVRVAGINGAAVGAGLAFALTCDVRLMAEHAFLDTGFSRLGLPGDCGVTYFLPQLIGQPRARAWLLDARRVGAREALGLGLVDRVVPPEALAGELRRSAERYARGSADAARWVRRPERVARELAAALADEREATLACKAGTFHRQALASLGIGHSPAGRRA